MSDLRLLTERSVEEIDAIFDAYAERGFEDLPSDMFFTIMHEIENEQPEQHNIEVESELIGNQLVLHPPTNSTLPVTVVGNEIIVGEYHISLRWLGVRDGKHPA